MLDELGSDLVIALLNGLKNSNPVRIQMETLEAIEIYLKIDNPGERPFYHLFESLEGIEALENLTLERTRKYGLRLI
jgi:hypothetical protein